MSYSDDQVDQLLEASAERWRATLPQTAEPDIATLVRGAGKGRAMAFPLGNVGALAALVVSVAVLALVVGSLYGAFGPARTSTPNASAGPVTGTAYDAPFKLWITASKASYGNGEAIDVTATLIYEGPEASTTIGHGGSTPIGFGIVEPVDGVQLQPVVELNCARTTLTRGVALEQAFGKSGSNPDANPSFSAFMQDPVLRLPPGTWHIYAEASFLEDPDCAGSQHDIRAEVTVTVSTATAPTEQPALYLTNYGGPAFAVAINGVPAGVVACGAGSTLTPGDGGLPGLPWQLTITRVTGGTTLLDEQVSVLPRWFYQTGLDPSGLVNAPRMGPAPPTCPPSGTPSPSVAPAGQPQALYIENRGGPAFTVMINGMVAADVGCGTAPMLFAGQDAVPPLPWDLKISRDRDGSVLVDERVTELPKWFVQIGDAALGLGGPVAGPPGPSCPPPVTPAPIVTPVPTPTCCATMSTPVPGETLAKSNAFWNYWADPPFPRPRPDATSIRDAVDLSDLVIRGHIVDIYIGEYWTTGGRHVPEVYVKVQINELFKGSPVSRTQGYVEIALGSLDPAGVDGLRIALPQHDNVWFLKYEPGPATRSEIAPYEYIPLNDQQGVLRDINGKVRLVKPQYLIDSLGPDAFPLPLEGTSFDTLVEQLRTIAGAT
jgi:hypothetical protein